MTIEVELKRAFKTGKVEIGLKDSEKSVLFGHSKAIVMSSTALDNDKIRLKYFCELEKIPFVLMNHVPIELGEVMGLSYSVTSVSIIDEGKSKVLSELKQ